MAKKPARAADRAIRGSQLLPRDSEDSEDNEDNEDEGAGSGDDGGVKYSARWSKGIPAKLFATTTLQRDTI